MKLWRWIQSPVATLVLGGLLAGSASIVDQQAQRLPDPLYLFSTAVLTAGKAPGAGELLLAIQHESGIEIMDPNNESWDRATRVLARDESKAFHVVWLPGYPDCRGVYANTWQGRAWGIWIEPVAFATAATPEVQREIRQSVIAWDRGSRTPRSAALSDRDIDELVRTGSARLGTRAWLGYLHNAFAIVVLVLFLSSLQWVGRIPAYLSATRRQRRLARGRCPHCNYSIVGLPEPVCPECGMAWNLTAEDDLPPGAPGSA